MLKNWRLYLIIVGFMLVAALLESRLFSLQIKQGWQKSKNVAATNSPTLNPFQVKRGSILIEDKAGKRYTLAFDREGYKVWVDTRKLDKTQQAIATLATALKLNNKEISERLALNSGSNYLVLNDFIDKETATKLQLLKAPGLNLEPKDQRTYPLKEFAAHALGFVSYKDNPSAGQYGVEEFYDEQLNGFKYKGNSDQQIKTGASLLLTIDYNVQLAIEKIMKQLIERNKADGGAIVVLDPKSGEILGLTSYPRFDPNQYRSTKLEHFKNRAIQENYEPGSVMKLVTMAAGLQEKTVTPTTKYEDKGRVVVKGTTIRNSDGKANGWQTMTQVLEKSLNTGAVFIEQKLNKVVFLSYFKKFGAGVKTGVDLVGETRGDIRNLFNFNDVDYATAAFGQGITVTPMQLAAMVSSIANNGTIMKPYLVKKIINADNSEQITMPEKIGEPLKPLTAAQLTGMMTQVVENGFDWKAKIKGYQIAAKTGTAQIPDLEKGGYSDETVHTIVGFAPAFNPKFVIVIRLDKPQGQAQFASLSLGPAFRDLTQFLLSYYQIPPTEPIK